MTVRESPAPPRAPRPLLAFFVSLAASSAVLGALLLWDHRVLELKNARAEVRELDRQIAEWTRENDELRLEIEAANRHMFPAEKVAREELHLVRGDDLVLLYPPGAITAPERKAGEKKPRR